MFIVGVTKWAWGITLIIVDVTNWEGGGQANIVLPWHTCYIVGVNGNFRVRILCKLLDGWCLHVCACGGSVLALCFVSLIGMWNKHFYWRQLLQIVFDVSLSLTISHLSSLRKTVRHFCQLLYVIKMCFSFNSCFLKFDFNLALKNGFTHLFGGWSCWKHTHKKKVIWELAWKSGTNTSFFHLQALFKITLIVSDLKPDAYHAYKKEG